MESVLQQVSKEAKERWSAIVKRHNEAPLLAKIMIWVTAFPIIPTASAATIHMAGVDTSMEFWTALTEFVSVSWDYAVLACSDVWDNAVRHFAAK